MRHALIALCLLLAAPALVASTPPLRSSTNWTQDGTAWRSGAYLYDDAGNIIRIGDDVYRYDRVGRLATATARTSPTSPNAQSFTYDQYGNMRSVTTTTATTTQTWAMAVNPATNQLTGSCPPSLPCFTALYDAAGNHLGRASTSEFEWDGIGALRQIRTARRERYVYDANDERTVIIDRAADTDGQRRFTLRGADNKVARELTYNPQGAAWKLEKDYVYRGATLIASFSSPTAVVPDRHYHVDHLGSTRVVTTGAAFRLATHTYWPFGQTAAGSDIDSERMKFTGHERDGSASDPASQLDYMHARYYDLGAFRFLSVDPGKDWSSRSPQSWNLYAYVRNTPLNAVDPNGRQAKEIKPLSVLNRLHNPSMLLDYLVFEFAIGPRSMQAGPVDVSAQARIALHEPKASVKVSSPVAAGWLTLDGVGGQLGLGKTKKGVPNPDPPAANGLIIRNNGFQVTDETTTVTVGTPIVSVTAGVKNFFFAEVQRGIYFLAELRGTVKPQMVPGQDAADGPLRQDADVTNQAPELESRKIEQ